MIHNCLTLTGLLPSPNKGKQEHQQDWTQVRTTNVQNLPLPTLFFSLFANLISEINREVK
jgi:hypothetical protein